ncbi:hypothetical protein D3C75_548360 [compost metagenome]
MESANHRQPCSENGNTSMDAICETFFCRVGGALLRIFLRRGTGLAHSEAYLQLGDMLGPASGRAQA